MSDDAERAKMAMLQYARANNIDSAPFVAALAEVVGMIAAVLDREAGYQRFDERMAEFTEMARASYLRPR